MNHNNNFKIFFGTLRQAETENLMERTWYAIIDTCLAFTMFRDDLSPGFVAAFTIFFMLKGFHWLCEDRVDFMERKGLNTLFTLNIDHYNLWPKFESLDQFKIARDNIFIQTSYYKSSCITCNL